MSSHTRPILSVGDVLGLVALLPLVIGKMLTFIAVSSWLQLKEGSLSVRALRRNAVASLGTAIGVLSPRQVRTLLVRTTGETITKYCVARTLSHQSELVVNDDGYSPATLHFVDCKLDGKGPILLYFHGGGFIAPLQSPDYAASLARAAGASLVLLEYTLAPECVYPGQLSQAIAALRLLLLYRSPSEIIIGGESAGGNIVLAVMAHLQEHKAGISPLNLPPSRGTPGKFRGVVAISPRTANKATASSFQYNNGKDLMNKNSFSVITETWRPENEVWAAPVLAKAGFWAGIRTERALLVVGGNEVYHDDVCHVAQVMGAREDMKETAVEGSLVKVSSSKLQLIVCPGEIHCQASLDQGLGIADGSMARGVSQWLSKLC